MLTFADHCPSNANKSRRIIWPHKDGQTKVSKLKTDIFIRRSKRGATKRTVSTEQPNENNKSSHKKPKWNRGIRIPTKTPKRKNQSSMNTIADSSKKAKTLPTFNKKSEKSVNIKKTPSLTMKETKSSSTIAPAVKGRVRASPKGKQDSSQKTNPSSQKKENKISSSEEIDS